MGVPLPDRRPGLAACAAGRFRIEAGPPDGLERALEQLRREQGLVESPTLAEFVDFYLAQHEGEPETTEKLRWLLAKAVRCSANDG